MTAYEDTVEFEGTGTGAINAQFQIPITFEGAGTVNVDSGGLSLHRTIESEGASKFYLPQTFIFDKDFENALKGE